MKKLLIICFLNIVAFNSFSQTGKWMVDTLHSSISFTVRHLLIAEVEGKFTSFHGTVLSDKTDFTDAKINFSVNVNSLNTNNGMRDKDLKSESFFDVKNYPHITFVCTTLNKLSENDYELTGKLSIHGISRDVKFKVDYGGTVKDVYGNTRAGFKSTTVVNRFDYGLNWNKLTETGGAVAGKDVNITVRVELIKMK